MACQLRIEDSAIARLEAPVLTLVSGATNSASEPIGSKLHRAAVDPYTFEAAGIDGAAPPAPADVRHAFFARSLRLLRDDIRHRTAPVLVLTSEARQDVALLAECVLTLVGSDASSVLHASPRQSFSDFLGVVCSQLNLAAPPSQGLRQSEESFDLFWNFLRAQSEQGRHLVVFVNDAHDMPEAFLEELALLSSFTKEGGRALQIVLIGLPPLRQLIRTLVKRQLIPEGCPAYTIGSLDSDEIGTFIRSERAGEGLECACMCDMGSAATQEAAEDAQSASRLVFTRCRPAELDERLGRAVVVPLQRRGDSDRDGAVRVDGHLWNTLREHRLAVAVVDASVDAAPRQEAGQRRALASCSTYGLEEGQVTRLADLTKILKNLQSRSPGVDASALISEDGLVLASALSPELDDIRVGGMTATLLSLGTRAAAELHRGEVHEVIVRGDNGYAVMVGAGSGTLLLVLTSEDTKLGLVFFDMREAIKSIAKILTRH